jgi:energy-converting hydrogenase B subunit K
MYATSSGCIGCRECINKCPTGAIRRTDDAYYLTCINCGECARSCPAKAIRKNRRGGYYVDKSRCTGCGICAATCPIDIIRMEKGTPRGICMKCGLCAKVCPAGARVDVGDASREIEKLFSPVPVSEPIPVE